MSEEGAIQVAEVMVPQVADREPQVLLGIGAKDLGRSALVFRLFGAEMNPATPHPILGAP